MKVYVISVVYTYPDVDGHGYVYGVCSTEAKAEEMGKEASEYAKDYLNPIGSHDADSVDSWYDVNIEEFTVE